MSENPQPDRLQLSPPDAAALDAVLNGAASDSPQRDARVAAWLKVLAAAPAPQAPADLLERTLAAVQQDRMTIPPGEPAAAPLDFAAPVRRRWSRRIAEIGAMAVAASLLFAVILVGMNQSHQSSARVACANNLEKFKNAFGTYAAAHDRALPALDEPADGNWLHSQSPQGARSNAANLLPLVNDGYLALTALSCPAKPAVPTVREGRDVGEIGYSYTFLYGATRPTWNGDSTTIVLADRNPMFVANATESAVDRNSPNHAGHGSYLLRADGHVSWETSPNVGPGGDNIWTVNAGKQRLTTYTGTETPTSAADVFLCP